MPERSYQLLVNNVLHAVTTAPSATLLVVLRDVLRLTGTKFNCEQGECGACTVLVDGRALNSCLILASTVAGMEIVTIEGLSDSVEGNVVEESFVDCDAAQCGYCTPAMIVSSVALLRGNPTPSRSEIEQALSGNYCRCTGYESIVRAIEDVAARGGRT